MLEVPEQAIRCFEKWSRTRVMVYDFCHEFRPVLEPTRNIHRHAICDQAKINDNARACTDFGYRAIKREIWRYRDGCLKICHYNLLEWCIPVYADARLLCILEAGIRQATPGANYPFPVIRSTSPCRETDIRVPSTDRGELLLVMEGLRQLAARLQVWHEIFHQEIVDSSSVSRHIFIHAFLMRNHRSSATLATVAKQLHLSPSRAAHVIKEETGKTFKKLLLEYRMRDACLRLLTTDAQISEVAVHSGFADAANFYRAFKKLYSMTPRHYRESKRMEMPS